MGSHEMAGKISVIIPTYNRKDLLGFTLSSIFNQTKLPDEVIVVDNHSTDGTMDWLKDTWGDKVIAVQNTSSSLTPGAARNIGLKIASGDFIKFFDSDDLMTSNTLEVQSELLEKSKSGYIYSPYFFAIWDDTHRRWQQTDPAILNYYPLEASRPLYHYMLSQGLFITIPGMLFDKKLLLQVGNWREDVTASEDWDYLFRISLIEPYPIHTSACAFLYRIHGAQTTEQNFNNEQRDEDKYKVLSNLYQLHIADNPMVSPLQKMLFRNSFFQLYRALPNDHFLKTKLRDYDNMLEKLVWQYVKLKKKAGRIKTETNWQPCHGPLVSDEHFQKYIQLIKL